MANTNGMNPLIPIFNGRAYESWNIKMRQFFILLDLWDMVENGYVEPTEEEGRLTPAQRNELKDNRKKDAKAFVALQQAVTDPIFPGIAGASSTKEAWNIVKKEYQGTEKVTAVKLQTFRREFENLRMKDGEFVDEFS